MLLLYLLIAVLLQGAVSLGERESEQRLYRYKRQVRYPAAARRIRGFDPVTSTVSVITSTTSSGVVQILPSSEAPPTTRIVQPTLQTEGRVSRQPIITSPIPPPKTLIETSVPASTPRASLTTTLPSEVENIFALPIATDAPPSAIGSKQDHPAPRKGIESSGPLQTNKFYSSFFLGDQHCPSYLFPYSVAWAKGSGAAASWGLAVSHIDPRLRHFGNPEPITGARKYYTNPVGIQSVCLSAKELGPNTELTSDSLTDTSVRISLRPSPGEAPVIQFPLVQGSAFITALYHGACPLIQTGIFFKTVTRSTREAKPGIAKFKLHLEDDSVWLLYAHHTNGSAPLDLQVINNGAAQARGAFSGVIQVAKDPGNAEAVYDAACGAYPMGFDLSGSVRGGKGEYSFGFRKGGLARTSLAMFALPHHQSSFSGATKGKVTDVKLDTPTKGVAALVVADEWTMVEEELPVSVGFLPWSPQAGTVGTLSDAATEFIHNIAMRELSQNVITQSDQDSMYFSGKVSTVRPKEARRVLASH